MMPLRPLLPTVDKLIPYIKRIDESRVYSNMGELNAEYQSRLGEMFGAPCITGSSATSLITATLMAYDMPKGSFVAMPSYTFPATAAAVVAAGYTPYFMDVDSNGVMVRNSAIYSCNAAVVVAPFGAPIDILAWEQLPIPVVIDAAAGFDAFSRICKPHEIPIVISTHATKAMGTGEGGFIVCKDAALLEKVRRITNFAFTPDRRIEYNGLNAKFSEYHAAVGLASLDGWTTKRELLLKETKKYGIDYAVTQIPVRGKGVMKKYGCHFHAAYSDYPRTELPVTNELIENVGAMLVGIE